MDIPLVLRVCLLSQSSSQLITQLALTHSVATLGTSETQLAAYVAHGCFNKSVAEKTFAGLFLIVALEGQLGP